MIDGVEIGAFMRIEEVEVVGKPLVRAKGRDVDRLESELWITFPAGYREYVTRLGEGVLGGNWVRIYPPWRIARELEEWRERIKRYWFWDAGKKLLPKARALECAIVGDTTGGDELVFHPTRPNRLFVLPRESDRIFEAGGDLLAAIDWLCDSGKLTKSFAERNFEPFDSRKEMGDESLKQGGGDPPGESFDDLMKAAAKWAKRHKLVAESTSWAKKLARDLGTEAPKVELRRQVMVFGTGQFDAQGFEAIFAAVDSKTNKTIAEIATQMTSDGLTGASTRPLERSRPPWLT